MQVIKRNGKRETVKFDKVLLRLRKLSYGLDTKYIDCEEVAKKTIMGIYDGVTTSELDNLAAEIAATMTGDHPDYSIFASRIAVSNIHKNVEKSFSKNMELLYDYIDPRTNKRAPLIADDVIKIVRAHADDLDSAIIHDRDYEYDYFGIMTLSRGYLLKRDGKNAETPQQMLMRVAVGINKKDIKGTLETYELLSKKHYTHASPTLFNSGTVSPQLSSCFLVAMKDDSIEGIFDTLKQTARISQYAGGVGVHIHNIRSRGSYIKGTGGTSNGIVPMLRTFNETARYVDQGGNKRKGAFAIYLEPWHADIFDFLDLKKNTGKEEMRARDLFYALWIPDLFMERVEKNGMWSLMDPKISSGLSDVYGDEFKKLYTKYEKEGNFVRQVKARDLWFKIIESQIETGTPYMLYKDAANEKSNQKNLGTIKSSNLCTEIMEYSSADETAVCNLASLGLATFLKKDMTFDHQALYDVVRVATRNLNKVIDINLYPTKEGETSNLKHRPIGLGVQGLADVFALMRLPFDSEGARQLNKEIFETIYFAALTESHALAKKEGTYKSYKGSPLSKGIFQFDMWDTPPSSTLTKRWDWAALRAKIKKDGVRNSLLVAPMPTASTSQILGNNEAFEPFTSNVYVRRVLHGEFIVVNKYLLRELASLGLWNEEMKHKLMNANGSVQNIEGIPQKVKDVYRTVWEIPQRSIIDMAADRAVYIDQSQSMNLHVEDPDESKLTSMHFYAWKKGLKTGMYYLRTKAARDAIKFTVDKEKLGNVEPAKKEEEVVVEDTVPAVDDEEMLCISCGA